MLDGTLRSKRGLAALVLAVSLSVLASTASATMVDLELSLVVDLSGSVAASGAALQKNGYEAAFRDASIQTLIEALAPFGGIAVNVITFNDTASEVIPWTQIQSAAEAESFADAIAAATFTSAGWTNIAAGIALATDGLETNAFEGTRKIIDVSGDGQQNRALDGSHPGTLGDPGCLPSANPSSSGCVAAATSLALDPAVADALLVADAINAIAIRSFVPGLETYFQDHVAPGGVTLVADSLDEFAPVVRDKIFREISDVPEPGSFLLVSVSVALLGLGVTRHRRG